MFKELISDKQGISLVSLFIMGSSLVLGTGASAKKDAWISIILSIMFSLIIISIYARILYKNKGKDFYDISIDFFGKFFGKIIVIIYIWFSIHLASLILRNFGEFIMNTSLENTPFIVSMILISVLCIFVLKQGIEVLGRWSSLVLILVVIVIIGSISLSIPLIDINNIRPILSNGLKPVLKASYSIFSFPFGETVLFLLIFSSFKNENSPYKIFIYGLLIGGFSIFVTSISELMVLGENFYTTLFFPAYQAVGRISIGEFIERAEIIAGIALLGGGFIKLSICILAASNGITKLIDNKDYRFIVTPVVLLTLNLSYFIYDSINQMFDWAFNTWVYYALPFQLIIPILVFIITEIKYRKKKEI